MARLRLTAVVSVLFLVAGTAAVAQQAATAELAPPALSAAAQLTPRARGYAQFELGKWAELQADGDPSSAYMRQALTHYQAALAADPQSIYLTGQVAELLSSSGQSEQAITLAQALVQAHPDNLEAHRLLGDIYLNELERTSPATANARQKQILSQAVSEYEALVRMDQTNAGEHVILGKLYGASGQAADAEGQFRAALNLDPADSDALASLVQTLAGEGHVDEAAAAIEAEPPAARTGRVYATLGGVYFGRHQYDEAAAAFQKAVRARPDVPEFQNDLAQALLENQDYAGALAAFQQLARETPNDGRAALRVAQMQMQLGRFSAASGSLDTAARLLPAGDLEVAYARALLAQSQGQNQAALTDLKALAARPNNARTQSIFLDQLGRLQMRTGDSAGALRSFQQLAQLGASYVARAQALELELFRRDRNYAQALALTRQQLSADPGARALQLDYARLQADSGDVKAALATLQPLLHGDAADAGVYLAMGQAQMQAHNWSQANDATVRAQALASTNAARALAAAQLAAIASLQRHYDDAEKELQLAMALDPANPDILNALGYVLAQRGSRLVDALAYSQQALRQDADNPGYLDTLGWIYFKMQRWPEALDRLERAARLDPGDPTILDHLAQTYAEQGEWPQAAESWTQALADVQRVPVAVQPPHLGSEIEKSLAKAKKKLKN